MKFLKKLEAFMSNDEHKSADIIDIIIDSVIDFIDDGFQITFQSSIGSMTHEDYVNHTPNYYNFQPVTQSGRTTKSEFFIIFNNISYEDHLKINTGILSTISKLSEEDWIFKNYQVDTRPVIEVETGSISGFKFKFIKYYFNKPDIKTGKDLPSVEDIQDYLSDYDMDIEICDGYIELEFHYSITGQIESSIINMINEFGLVDYEVIDRTRVVIYT